jgi:hypothetical protein
MLLAGSAFFNARIQYSTKHTPSCATNAAAHRCSDGSGGGGGGGGSDGSEDYRQQEAGRMLVLMSVTAGCGWCTGDGSGDHQQRQLSNNFSVHFLRARTVCETHAVKKREMMGLMSKKQFNALDSD